MVDQNSNYALQTSEVYVHYGKKMAINNVALNFDEHVNQSIPHYKDIQKYARRTPRLTRCVGVFLVEG